MRYISLFLTFKLVTCSLFVFFLIKPHSYLFGFVESILHVKLLVLVELRLVSQHSVLVACQVNIVSTHVFAIFLVCLRFALELARQLLALELFVVIVVTVELVRVYSTDFVRVRVGKTALSFCIHKSNFFQFFL